jgi:hypothetical protein
MNTKHLCSLETGCYSKILVLWPNKVLLFLDTFGIKDLCFGLLESKAVRSCQAIKNGVDKGLRNAQK